METCPKYKDTDSVPGFVAQSKARTIKAAELNREGTMSKDKTTKNEDGSVTVVREVDEVKEFPGNGWKAVMHPTDGYCAERTDLPPEPQMDVEGRLIYNYEIVEKLREEVATLLTARERLTAHLVSKGYGHATIKRILAGEVVR